LKTVDDLRRILHRIDGRGYKAYKDIAGTYSYGPGIKLEIMYVQGDPFASPSRLRAIVDSDRAGFPAELFSNRSRRVALEDFLVREFGKAITRFVRGSRGTGKSGLIAVDRPGQEILERTAVVVDSERVEARFFVGLPARGRTVLGQQAEVMLTQEIPRVIRAALFFESIDQDAARTQVELAEDQDYLRAQLKDMGLVAFVGDGAILPRESGISDLPMRGERVVPFRSPDSLRVSVDLPNRGTITGMGVPRGVTLIVGGGYHGKSTLLRAIERGIYNHILGDGREFVISSPAAVKIRAEDGRRVEKVNISPFINNLPQGQDTVSFSSEGASGSTSQAANIMEALEMGVDLLLLDEDTSATNFMIRDIRMQKLVAKDKEPITPFIDKVRQLYEEMGVSTTIVVGGSGDYFDVADTVIMMDEYCPRDVTADARRIAAEHQEKRFKEGGDHFGDVKHRRPLTTSFNPQKGRKNKVAARGLDSIQFGRTEIELQYVEQLVDVSQTRAIADIIYYGLRNYFDGRRTLNQVLEAILRDIEKKGLDVISPFGREPVGDHALPRKFEIAAAINRMRTLKVR